MRNYFNYFTEIEERFQQRRGSLLMLSTVDWALIDTWRSLGIPLEAVLRGIDAAFDKHNAKKQTGHLAKKKINGLAWCAQSVMEATEEMAEAAVGSANSSSAEIERESGFEAKRIMQYLRQNAAALGNVAAGAAARPLLDEVARRLEALASELSASSEADPEQLEAALLALEERVSAVLKLDTPATEIEALYAQAAREVAPHRSRMQGAQLRMVQEHFIQKQLLQKRNLPRLSLFYMSHD